MTKERYWSGGIDRSEHENVEVFVNGKQIQIGVQNGINTALLNISPSEAEHVINMLQSALKHAEEWGHNE